MANQISASELELMKIIWDAKGKALYAFIMDRLVEKDSSWKKNTVLTLLSRLVEKRYLSVSKIGHRNEYIALITEQEYLAEQTRGFVENVYDGNVKGLVATLLQQDIISAAELDELRDYWKGECDE